MNSLVATIRQKAVRAASIMRGSEENLSHGQRRYRRIGRGFSMALLQRGTNFLTGVATVPLTIHYLGADRYGLWVTITSMIGWLRLSDAGLSNSVTVALTSAYGKDDKRGARQIVSSGFYGLSLIALLLIVLFAIIAPLIPWNSLFHVQSPLGRREILPSVIVAFAIFVIGFPFSIGYRILDAFQEFIHTNLWLIAANILTLVALVVAYFLRVGLPVLILCFTGVATLTSATCLLWIFRKHKPWLRPSFSAFNLQEARQLLSQGGWFFLAGLGTAVNCQTDLLVISHYVNTSAATPYSVTIKLFSYSFLIPAMIGAFLFSSYGEAKARNDFQWIKKTLQRHLLLTGIGTVAASIILYLAGYWIILYWAGSSALPSNGLLLWTAIWSVLASITYPLGALLGGMGRPKGMAVYIMITAVVNLTLSIWWVQQWGVVGVIAASTISYACIEVPLISIETWKQLNKFKTANKGSQRSA